MTNKADPFSWKEPTYVKPKYELKAAVPRDVLDWFHNRGITDKTLLRNKIRYEKVYMPQVEDFKDAIRFPFLRNGEVVNVKSRTLDKEFRLETNAERILYGMDDITGEEAIIVEGEVDKLSVEEAGLLNCVSVPNGAPAVNTKDYPAQFTFLESCEDLVTRVKTWILAVDNDEPGQKLEEELARRIGRHKCKRVKWPEGCKDANDVLMKHGRNEVLSCIRGARDYPVEGIFEINDIIAQIDALYNRPIHRGELTGWKCMDELYTVRAGEWTLVTGIPSSGKSEWVDALMINLMKEKQWRFAVFSPENQPLELHFSKLAEKVSEKPFFGKDRMTPGDLAVAKEYINLYFTFILPAEEKSTIDGILDLARYVVLKKGIQGLVIDPWNEIDHSRPSTLSETEYISRSLSKIRRFARENAVHVWLVAHPTKLLKNPKTQTYPVPTPYDVAGCYAEGTEVLTKRGWIDHANVTLEDEVCCFNLETETLGYSRPTRLWKFAVNEELVRLKSPSYDILVTANHNVAVKPQWHRKPSFQRKYRGSGLGRPQKFTGKWQFIKASEIASDLLLPWSTPFDNNNKDLPGWSDPEIMFIGWWIAEGSETHGSLGICQATGPLADKMRATMDKMRYPYWEETSQRRTDESPIWKARIKVRYDQGADGFCKTILRECGIGCGNKRLPSFTWAMSDRQKRILLNAYLEGDGTRRRNTVAASTTSKGLVDDLQRLAVELGMMSGYSMQPRAKEHHFDKFQINFARENRRTIDLRKKHVSFEHYKGDVFCLTVPTGAYVIRRNGKTGICGNSAHFRNKADNCIAIHRPGDPDDPQVDVHVQKIRFKIVGKVGMKTLLYDRKTGIYRDLVE